MPEAFCAAGPICPFCGQHVGGDVRPYCTPISCPLWTVEATYNHQTRQWERTP